jgi:hypothetical protein
LGYKGKKKKLLFYTQVLKEMLQKGYGRECKWEPKRRKEKQCCDRK